VPIDAPELDTEAAESAPKKRRGPWPLIVVVLVLTLVAVWLVPSETPTESETADEAQPPSLLESPAVAPTAEPPAAEAEAKPVIDDRPGAKARALIAQMRSSSDLSLDDLYAEAKTAQAAGELADAYLLYFYAAREGHGGAAMTLAQQADPAYHSAGESVFETPDLLQAHKWYQAAAQSGNDDAWQALEALRKRVDQMAADGDPTAQRIALMWQQ
jgi:TPR repeat protein